MKGWYSLAKDTGCGCWQFLQDEIWSLFVCPLPTDSLQGARCGHRTKISFSTHLHFFCLPLTPLPVFSVSSAGLSTRCRGLFQGVATPAVLCHKEPARESKPLYYRWVFFACSSLVLYGISTYNRTFPCMEALCHKERSKQHSDQWEPNIFRHSSTNESWPDLWG